MPRFSIGGDLKLKKIDVVGAVIINDQDDILCALRGRGMSMEGYWEFPGGKIEKGETPQQALRREIREELGCDIQIEELIEDTIHQYPELEVHFLTFRSKVLQGIPSPKEHSELRWMRSAELLDLNWAPADIPTVNTLMAKDRILKNISATQTRI